ncbi:serine hydrolase domain-containing protein [Streptomyces puniciscabiei]
MGASVAVYIDGKPVVDIWGGYADADRSVSWERDTITNVMSTTKKSSVKAVDDIYDWESVTARLAAQAPEWEPGTAAGYHSLTFGFLVGEIVRRITGRSIGEFFAEEVAEPLGADFRIGLAEEHDHRVAPLIPPPSQTEEYAASAPPGSAGAPGENSGAAIRVKEADSAAWRRAQIPAASGFGNARSVGLVQSVPASHGSVGGVHLLSPHGCEPAWQEVFRGVDGILGARFCYAMGFGDFGNTFGWGGWGGSMVVSDPGPRMTAACVMKQMIDRGQQEDNRALEIVMAAYDGLR